MVEAPTQMIRALGYAHGNVLSMSLFRPSFPAAKTKSVFAQVAELIAACSVDENSVPP